MENEKLNQEALKKAESVISKWRWENGIAWSPEALMAAIQAYLASVPQPNDADVVEVMEKVLYDRTHAQAAIKALSDNGYRIVKEG